MARNQGMQDWIARRNRHFKISQTGRARRVIPGTGYTTSKSGMRRTNHAPHQSAGITGDWPAKSPYALEGMAMQARHA
jgi:hypothetical protein